MTGFVMIPSSGPLVQEIHRGGARLFRESAVPSAAPSKSLLVELYKKWFLVSSLIRFSVSGNIGAVFFYIIERMIYRYLCSVAYLPDLLEEYKDSVSYFFGYLIQIVTQHLLNAALVYGLDTIETREKYFKTLLGQFSVYGFSLVGSTILNLFLLQQGMDRNTSFFATMILFAVVNYFLVQYSVNRTTATIQDKEMIGSRKKKDTTTPKGSKNKKNTVLPKISRGGATATATAATTKSRRSWFGMFKRPKRDYRRISGEAAVDPDKVNESCVAFVRQCR